MDRRGRRGSLCGMPINLSLSPSLFINGEVALGGGVGGGEGRDDQRRANFVCTPRQSTHEDSEATKIFIHKFVNH